MRRRSRSICFSRHSRVENPDVQANILRGVNTSLKGRHGISQRRRVGMRSMRKLKTSPNPEVRREALALGVTFGGKAALEEMREDLHGNTAADAAARRAALESLLLVGERCADAVVFAHAREGVRDPCGRRALRGLAQITRMRPNLGCDSRCLQDARYRGEARCVEDHAARRVRPVRRAFLAAVDAGDAQPLGEINAPAARQLQDLHDK